jgi:3-oxoacyl-[acyl-carrier protein] reductase
MTLDFNGKTVAVSGAALGFGRAIGASFAAAGARVYGCDILDAPDDGAPIIMAKVDLLNRQAGAQWIALVENETGSPIDILV